MGIKLNNIWNFIVDNLEIIFSEEKEDFYYYMEFINFHFKYYKKIIILFIPYFKKHKFINYKILYKFILYYSTIVKII